MHKQKYVKSLLMDALYAATLLEMLSTRSDEYPAGFALRGAGLARLLLGDWSSYRRAKMRELQSEGKVIIEYHFGSLVYRIDPSYFDMLHGITRFIVGDNSIHLPDPLQLSFVK